MTHYIIRGDSVTALASRRVKSPRDTLVVSSADDIAASDLPAARLVTIWNALPGITPVAKFKDRQTAARRLWAAFERFAATKPARPEGARAGTQQARVIALLRRAGGATVDEIATATGWQAHTVRGMISGALKKKLGLDVASAKEPRGPGLPIITTAKKAT
jgi:hypothetical protein